MQSATSHQTPSSPLEQPLDGPLLAGLAIAAALLPGLLVAVLLGALLSMVVWAAPAQGQAFFAESDVLREESALSLTFSDLTERGRNTNGPAVDYTDVDATTRIADGRLRFSSLGLGAMVESRRLLEVAPTYQLRDDRDQTAGYVALVLSDLLLDKDALFLVGSGSSRDERFAYVTYLRDLQSDVKRQWGLMYRVGFLVAGYAWGHQAVHLSVTDLVTVRESYEFDFTTRMAALVFGTPRKVGLQLVWQRKETPAVTGIVLDLEVGHEELQRVSLGLGTFFVDYAQTRFREAFRGDGFRESTEHEAALGFSIGEPVRLSLSQKRTVDEHGFSVGGLPSGSHADRKENLVRVTVRF